MNLDPGSVKSLLDQRRTAIAEFDMRTERMIAQLLTLVPNDSLREYIRRVEILNGLFMRGQNFGVFYGGKESFGDLETIFGMIEALSMAWEGLVRIKVATPNNERIEVYYYPA